LRGPLLGYDDEHLGTRKRREAVLQGYVVVPLGHDRDASRPAADRDLAVPAGEIAADPGEALTAARIAEPAHALDQRGLESGRVPAARTGVTGSNTSLSSAAFTRGTFPWISNSSAASRKNPARVQYVRTSAWVGAVSSGRSPVPPLPPPGPRTACPAASRPTSPYG